MRRCARAAWAPGVHASRGVLLLKVTPSECVSALRETGQCVGNALKLIKLRQLLATGLGGEAACKQALVSAEWDVTRAVDTLQLAEPELVHL